MAKDPRDAKIYTADKGIQPPSPDEGPTMDRKAKRPDPDASIFTADKKIQPPKNDDMGSIVKKAKGGKVSSASSRADGCAVRGKTKGRMV